MDDDDYDYEQVLQYENEIYQINEESSESESELTNALAQIYYAVDNSNPNVSNNQDVVPKHEVTTNDIIVSKKNIGTNNVPLENILSRSSQKDSKQESVHSESDAMPHKRKRITYDEEDYSSYVSGKQGSRQRGGRQRCALCKGHNHDERTCDEIRYPDNEELTWRRYNKQEATGSTRSLRAYCYNCAGNHFGQDCPSLTGSSSSFRNGMWYITKRICQV
ncbi:hypothetical protein C1645_580024 [Glomus cerebriforme]|uniref:CCHC-type domain-containing protein n=1 Tax=Glomus cerebriforme TaxID=658196 RepID=A0A397SAK4_9GLOM|nr:hypothetical protein C1645_580024 [Glomus cerebriforme]